MSRQGVTFLPAEPVILKTGTGAVEARRDALLHFD
jgi:hypothetical protein